MALEGQALDQELVDQELVDQALDLDLGLWIQERSGTCLRLSALAVGLTNE